MSEFDKKAVFEGTNYPEKAGMLRAEAQLLLRTLKDTRRRLAELVEVDDNIEEFMFTGIFYTMDFSIEQAEYLEHRK